MSTNRTRTISRGVHWLALGALLVLVLGLTACEEWVAMVADDVQEAYLLDLRDPQEVATAALGSEKLGDKDKADGLDVYRALRRVEYEQKGYGLLLERKPAEARQAFEEALKWTPGGDVGVLGNVLGGIADALLGNQGPQDQGTPAQRQKRADLYSGIAWTYEDEVETTTDTTRKMELKRRASKARAQAAALESKSIDRALDYRMAAYSAYDGADRGAACQYMKRAQLAENNLSAEYSLKAWGCP